MIKSENYSFIDRYFESETKLLDIQNSEKKDLSTFSNYLENLHSLSDKFKSNFNIKIDTIPEYVILRIIRNYFHHVDDIKEFQIFVELDEWAIFEYNRHLILPMRDFAKAILNFTQYTKNKKFISRQLELVCQFIDKELVDKMDQLLGSNMFIANNKEYELGIDIFKYVYNISNIIADFCRNIEEVKNKKVILNLEDTYTCKYNIPKKDILVSPCSCPVMTTQGIIFIKA